jgi:hypothetical protein
MKPKMPVNRCKVFAVSSCLTFLSVFLYVKSKVCFTVAIKVGKSLQKHRTAGSLITAVYDLAPK